MKNLDAFDWGPYTSATEYERICITEEVFTDRVYERYFSVKEGDVVFDIGANVGSFTYSILDRNPSKVFCVEPSKVMIDTVFRNTRADNIVYINKAIRDQTTTNIKVDQTNLDFIYQDTEYNSITFKDIIETHKIEKIDFMKIDCEGGEYSVFTKDNYDYIIKNVKRIAGEWHISGFDKFMDEFKKFRDIYLKGKNNFIVIAKATPGHPNASSWIFDDNYLNWYSTEAQNGAQFHIYIDNTVEALYHR